MDTGESAKRFLLASKCRSDDKISRNNYIGKSMFAAYCADLTGRSFWGCAIPGPTTRAEMLRPFRAWLGRAKVSYYGLRPGGGMWRPCRAQRDVEIAGLYGVEWLLCGWFHFGTCVFLCLPSEFVDYFDGASWLHVEFWCR